MKETNIKCTLVNLIDVLDARARIDVFRDNPVSGKEERVFSCRVYDLISMLETYTDFNEYYVIAFSICLGLISVKVEK